MRARQQQRAGHLRWWLLMVVFSGLGFGTTCAAARVAQENYLFSPRSLVEPIVSRIQVNYAVDPFPPVTLPPLRPDLVAAVLQDAKDDVMDRGASAPTLGVATLTDWQKELKIGDYAPPPEAESSEKETRVSRAETIETLEAQRRERQRRAQQQRRRVKTEAIAKQIKQRTRGLRACYERYLKTHSRAEGRLRIELLIDDRGSIEEVKVLKDSFEGSEVRDCLTERMRGWRFAPPAEGAFRVVVPIAFTRRL